MKKFFLLITILLVIPTVLSATFTCTSQGGTLTCNFPANIESILNSTLSTCNKIYNKPMILTSGTEYYPNEAGRVFLRLLDGNSNSINLGRCNTTVYYPNNTKFINNQQMTLLEKGYYYYDLTTPNITGNYIVGFDCLMPSIPFIQNVTLQGIVLEAGESDQYYEVDFGFDNSNNVTINSAWVEVKVTGSIAGCVIGVDFNNKRLGTLNGINPALGNYTLNQSDFYLTDEQKLILVREGTGVDYLWWVRLYVNYTWNNPQQIVRGQNELHIRNTATVNYTNNQTFLFNVSFNGTVNVINNVTVNITENITQFNDTNIINNITATNSSIFGKLYKIQDEIASVNETVKSVNSTVNWWGDKLNSTIYTINSTLNYWGDLLNTTINYWGNALETKIDNIILGNVTVTAVVDYDKIAIYVMSYLKAMEKIKVI